MFLPCPIYNALINRIRVHRQFIIYGKRSWLISLLEPMGVLFLALNIWVLLVGRTLFIALLYSIDYESVLS